MSGGGGGGDGVEVVWHGHGIGTSEQKARELPVMATAGRSHPCLAALLDNNDDHGNLDGRFRSASSVD